MLTVLFAAYTDPVLIIFVIKFVTDKLVNKPFAIVLLTADNDPILVFVNIPFTIVLVKPDKLFVLVFVKTTLPIVLVRLVSVPVLIFVCTTFGIVAVNPDALE